MEPGASHDAGRTTASRASEAGAGSAARGLSVGTKLAGATIALIIAVTAVLYSQLSAYQRERLLNSREMAARAVTRLFADSCAAPIVFEDDGAIQATLGRLGRSDDIPF